MSITMKMNSNKVKPPDASPSRPITPKRYFFVVLLVITAIAGANAADQRGILNVGVAMLTAILCDGTVALFQGRKSLFSDGGIITGLIVALVLSSSTPWYIIVATTAIALVSKHLLKIKRRPVFNPAALGLLVSIFLFSSGQSWWGAFAELPIWAIAYLFVVGYLVTERVNKFPQVLAFLGSYFLLLLIMGYLGIGHAGDALRTPFINCALFFAFFMVTDPPTSPAKDQDQIWFGIITAIVSAIVYLVFGGLSFLLIGLLLANAWNAVYMGSTPKVNVRSTMPREIVSGKMDIQLRSGPKRDRLRW